MTTHEKNPPHVGEGQPGGSDREAFSTGVDEPPAATLPGTDGGSNAAQRRAAALTNDQILAIAKHHFRADHSMAPETLTTYCDSVRAVITAYALDAPRSAMSSRLRICEEQRDGNWYEFSVNGHSGMIRVVARMEDDEHDHQLGRLVRDFLLAAAATAPVVAPRAAVPAGWRLVPIERSYDMRVKSLVAFNAAEKETCDRDDALDAAHRATLDAAPAAPVAAPVCSTCNGNGRIGGPSFYAPDEGGIPCPDCAQAPGAPVAEPAPNPLLRRVERLLVELHAEGRLSEGQCAKVLDISRVDWRELAEFLAPANQAVTADGAEQETIAWDDCKVAFGVDDEEGLWSAVGPGGSLIGELPQGWKLNETDCSGARCVGVFRVEGIPTRDEGYIVRNIINSIEGRAAVSPAEAREPFQARVQPWMLECFGPVIAADRIERNHRFLEEALELVQALGCTASEAHQLVDYTFGRPIGKPAQEVGGVMVTLAALCLANTLDMHEAGETELARISEPAMVEKIRAKQAAKPKHSPLPGYAPAVSGGTPESPIAGLIARHAAELERNAYTYFELAYTRHTDWMAWITDRPAQGEPGTAAYAKSRKVIARGQGETAEAACQDALAAIRAPREEGDR